LVIGIIIFIIVSIVSVSIIVNKQGFNSNASKSKVQIDSNVALNLVVSYPKFINLNKTNIEYVLNKKSNITIQDKQLNPIIPEQTQTADKGLFNINLVKGVNVFNIVANNNGEKVNKYVEINYNTYPEIQLTTPLYISTETYKTSTTIAFTVIDTSKVIQVTINKDLISTSDNQTYQKDYPLSLGDNKFNISVKDTDGNIQNSQLIVKRTPTVESKFPILMYHHILEIQKDSDYLSPNDFEDQLNYLKSNNYISVSFQNLNDYLLKGTPISTKGIILSFDDSYIDAYTKAFPLLLKYNIKGSFCVITRAIGNPEEMSWSQLKELVGAGMEIVSHSHTHHSMKILNNDQLRKELLGSKEILEGALGIKVKTFVYPSGEFNDNVITQLKKYGYESARTTKHSLNISVNDMFRFPTIRISKGNTGKRLGIFLSELNYSNNTAPDNFH